MSQPPVPVQLSVFKGNAADAGHRGAHSTAHLPCASASPFPARQGVRTSMLQSSRQLPENRAPTLQ